MNKKAIRGIRPLNVLFAYAGSYVLFFMMLLTTCDVVGRYILKLPIKGAYEITEAMMVTLVFLFLAYTQANKGHVSVDLALERMPPKIQFVIKLITQFISIIMIGLIAWMSIIRWLELMEMNEHTPILHLPASPFLLIIALGSIAFCIELGKDIRRHIKRE